MALHTLEKIVARKKRRLGQGHGTGRGKTAGRGTKGQKARGDIPIYFEGGAIPLIKRLPFRRGKGKNNAFKEKPIVINIKALSIFSKGATIDTKALIDRGLVKADEAREYGVKILGDGDLTTALIIKVAISQSAAKKVEKAGGQIVQ